MEVNNKSGEAHTTAPSDSAPSEKPKKKKSNVKSYLLSGVFLVALMAVTFYVIFKDNSIKDIWGVLKHVKLVYASAGILAMLGFFYFQGLVINLSSQCVKIKLSTWEMMQYSFVGFFYSGITPSAIGGQPMQFYHMCRDKMNVSLATLVLFVANLTYQIVIVVLGLVMFIAKHQFVERVNGTIVIFFFLGLSVNLIILLIIAAALLSETLLRKVLNIFVSFLTKIKIIKNPESALKSIENYLEEFKSGVGLLKANKLRFFFILLSTSAHFLLYHMIPFFVYRAFGFMDYSLFDFVAISAVMYVAINMFPLPGSVGAAESGFVLLFTPFFGKVILPAMLLSRFINFYTMIILSGIFAAFAQLRRPYNLSDKGHELKQ
jgi:glycosyltransferase 2 family protein